MTRRTQRLIAASLAALSIGLGSAAFADDHDDHGRGQDNYHHDDRAHDRHDDRRDDHHDNGDHRRGAGPEHSFYRGGRLPDQYRRHEYVVQDWRGRHLSAPPRGYQWVQTGNDYVLAAIATGVIASILLSQ